VLSFSHLRRRREEEMMVVVVVVVVVVIPLQSTAVAVGENETCWLGIIWGREIDSYV